MIAGDDINVVQVRYPTAGSSNSGAGSRVWTINGFTNANNSKQSDSLDADSIAKASQVSNVNLTQRLFLQDFDFNIPSDAVIKGILAEFWTSSLLINSALNPATRNSELYLLKNGVVSGTNKALGTSDDVDAGGTNVGTIWQAGGDSDLWGNTLTPEDVNDPDFGISMQFEITQEANNDIKLFRASVAVIYEPAPLVLSAIG